MTSQKDNQQPNQPVSEELDKLLDHLVIGEERNTGERVVQIWYRNEIIDAKQAFLALIEQEKRKSIYQAEVKK